MSNNNNINHNLSNDQQYKSTLINSTVTNKQRYNDIITLALEDFTGIAEAYKNNLITNEEEAQEQFRIFLEEYTVNLINLLKEQQKELE